MNRIAPILSVTLLALRASAETEVPTPTPPPMIDRGVLMEVRRDHNGDVFLNMDGAYPNERLTLVIFHADKPNFDLAALRAMIGHHVLAAGEPHEYRSRPQIIIHTAGSIQQAQEPAHS